MMTMLSKYLNNIKVKKIIRSRKLCLLCLKKLLKFEVSHHHQIKSTT